MASIRCKNDQFVFVNFADIIIHRVSEGTTQHLTNKRWIQNEDANKSQPDTGSLQILATNFSPSGRYFAYCDDYKQLVLYKIDQCSQWQHVSTRGLTRRCMSVIFSAAEDEILVADKSGDVYGFSVVEQDKNGTLLMGHLSTLLDIVFTKNSKYLISCDRDEKIRIGHYPNLYNIQSFCLGHSQYVFKLTYLENLDTLMSASGDGSIRCWEIESGKQICSYQIKNCNSVSKAITCFAYCKVRGIVAVSCDSSNEVHLLRIDTSGAVDIKHVQTLDVAVTPMDMCFDGKGKLWVLTNDVETFPLRAYEFLDESYTSVDPNKPGVVSEEFKGKIQHSLTNNSVKETKTPISIHPALLKNWDTSDDRSVGQRNALKRKLETVGVHE